MAGICHTVLIMSVGQAVQFEHYTCIAEESEFVNAKTAGHPFYSHG